MPSFSSNVVSNAQFKPFSFSERMAPILLYQEKYDKMQDNLLALGEEANQWQQYIDADPQAKKILEDYNINLNNLSDSLAQNGLKAVNRNTLLSLRRNYNETVRPLNDAAKTLATMYDAYRKQQASDPTLMRSNMPTVTELMQDPGASPTVASGKTLYEQGVKASSAASARKFAESEFGKQIIRGYIKQVERQGYSPELVEKFMEDAAAIPELAEMIQNIQSMYGTANLENPTKANAFIMQGILDGIGYKQTTSYHNDIIGAEERAQQRAISNENLRHRHAMQEAAAKAGGKSSSSAGATTTMYFKRDRDTAARTFVDSKTGGLKNLDALFDANGKFRKPDAEIHKGKTFAGPYGEDDYEITVNASDRSNYDKLYEMLSKYYSPEQIEGMNRQEIEQFVSAMYNDSTLDMQGTSQYRWQLDDSGTEHILQVLANRGGELVEIKDRKNDGSFVYGKANSIEYDSKKKKNAEVRYDPQQNELILYFDNKYYQLPKSLLSDETLRSLQSATTVNAQIGASPLEFNNTLIAQAERALSSAGIYDVADFVASCQEALQSGRGLSEDAKYYYILASKYLGALQEKDDIDGVFSSVGNELMSYTGKKNLNSSK